MNFEEEILEIAKRVLKQIKLIYLQIEKILTSGIL